MNRSWAMPNKNTFNIKPIKELIERYLYPGIIIDPFVNDSIFKNRCTFTNDLNPDITATHHLDAIDFLKSFADSSIDIILFDPPYSPRQISESYKSVGLKLFNPTQSSFYSTKKDEIVRIIKPKGIVLSFGWNSNGLGKKRGFKILEILLVAHGSAHNDTICIVEIKDE